MVTANDHEAPAELVGLLDHLVVEVQRLRTEVGTGDVWMARPAAAAVLEATLPVVAAVDRWHEAASAIPWDDVDPHPAPTLVGRSLVDAVAALDAEGLARTKGFLVWELRSGGGGMGREWLTRALSLVESEEARRLGR